MTQSKYFFGLLVIVSVIFWVLPHRLRIWFLVLASSAYLMSIDPFSTIAAGSWGLAVYFLSPWTARSASVGPIATVVLALLTFLAVFKYLPALALPVATNIGLSAAVIPLGISYYTFKLVHYAIESSRRNLPPHGLGDFLAYIWLFPTFSAGPIERMDHFLENREVRWTISMVTEALTRIVFGLIKRFVFVELVLAPLMATHPTIRHLVAGLSHASILDVWRYLVLSYLIAYLDFSAYTDIAIGCSRLFGIKIMENFRFPIASTNIAEFWRRWHMTLAAWCQQYVYMPIIGWTRNPYLAIYLTFITMGLWHAASFEWLAWALYHATGVVVYNQWARRQRGSRGQPPMWRRVLGTSLTFLFVSAGYAFTTAHGQATVLDSFHVLAAALGIRPFLLMIF